MVKKELNDKGVEAEFINYFERPITAKMLKILLAAMGLSPAEAIRKKEPAYKEFVAGRELSDAALIEVMTEHPELIQGPIVVKGSKAVIPRPVEKLKGLGP